MLKKLKEIGKKANLHMKKAAGKVAAGALAVGAMLYSASPTFAAVSTGNADLDSVITQLDEGATSMKVGGMYIIGAIIVIAIAIFGIRWIWGIFRGWMTQAR